MSIPKTNSDDPNARPVAGSKPTRLRLPTRFSALPAKRSEPWTKMIPSLSVSFVVHALLLLILSWIYFDLPNRQVLESILSLIVSDQAPLDNTVEFSVEAPAEPVLEVGDVSPDSMIDSIVNQEDFEPREFVQFDTDSVSEMEVAQKDNSVRKPPPKSAPAKSTKTNNVAMRKGIPSDEEATHADHFVGRHPKAKAALLKKMGGTDASEAAVARGLVWLRNHQLANGSWNFYHLYHPRCDCTQPGRNDNNPYAATAMALMAFLGAGQTDESGDYQPEIKQGLDFLLASGTKAPKGICFYGDVGGSQPFYTHGLVTIALSEALAMTGDPRLRPAVTGAVDFLAATQEPGGGWRYFPGQPGDTSVVAWEVMALKSAQFCRVPVPQKVFRGVDRFMTSVASQRGTQYAYTPNRRENATPSMTAAGLLCRMYLDWEENKGRLLGGIQLLDQFGPDPNNMYYNYYATQVMHHWGGPEWDRWNELMREHLIRTQVLEGHGAGSWDVADPHGYAGGRLYMTTLSLLTLEVYYRHLPLYQKDRIEVPLMNGAAAAKQTE
jgi:hypothetical protein